MSFKIQSNFRNLYQPNSSNIKPSIESMFLKSEKLINNSKFYCINKDTYPPFKNGDYLEEYFIKKFLQDDFVMKRKYIPALWTNFQIESWFNTSRNEMQTSLDDWVKNNPSPNGYFTVVQYDDGPLLRLPENTIVYGSCSGDIPIPLIYEDQYKILENYPKKHFNQKKYLCSFVGSITANHISPNTRREMVNHLKNNKNFIISSSEGWTPAVKTENQTKFIETTINSKFVLSPRGYGRSSFRFFECFQLGSIPVYIYNDIEWLPFKDKIDYKKICISIHVSKINDLERMLLEIDEKMYNDMLDEYEKIKHYFTLEGLYNNVIQDNLYFTSKESN